MPIHAVHNCQDFMSRSKHEANISNLIAECIVEVRLRLNQRSSSQHRSCCLVLVTFCI